LFYYDDNGSPLKLWPRILIVGMLLEKHIWLGIARVSGESGTMKQSLDHLPEGKRCELDLVVETVREGFARAIKFRTQPRFRQGKLLKIILFGSYARGDWVEDPVGRYFSDYDLLVVVDHEDLTDVPEFWLKTEDKFLEMLAEGTRLRTPVSLIYHSLEDVNEKLRLGRYFFSDILRDGIVLFEEPEHPFVEPQPLSAVEALAETQEYFEEWFASAVRRAELANDALAKGYLKEAAFDFHQATERFYQCLFLVRTLYMLKTHNLNRLRSLAEDMEPRLKQVWPSAMKSERQAYARLREAYIKARYSKEFRITAEQLTWLGARIAVLKSVVETVCVERLNVLSDAA
jgi:predicted nucleotidyltransferase/HEPN domain-containing protein